MNRLKVSLTILTVLCLSACSDEKEQRLERQIAALSNQVDQLFRYQAELREQENQLRVKQDVDLEMSNWKWESTGEAVDSLIRNVGFLRPRVHEAVVLDTTAKGFQRIDTDNGSFFMSLVDVQSYLDGYKVRLNIGNPSSASYQGIRLRLKWGKAEPPDPNEATYAAFAAHGSPTERQFAERAQSLLSLPLPPTNAPHAEWTKFQKECEKVHDVWQKSLHYKSVDLTDELRPGTWNQVEAVLSPAKSDELGYLQVSIETTSVWLTKPQPKSE